MRTSIAVDVATAPSRVFALAHDIARWPLLLPHYRKVTIRSRNQRRVLAEMVAVRQFGPAPLPVAWRAEQWSDESDPADLRLHFRHVRGVTRGMAVTWHIRPREGGARVTIEHDFSRRLPLVGSELLPRLVDRFFVRPIAGRTLRTFKRLAEQGG
ncbi:MAG: SRPBCC family protein [Chloroflexota bacterium]|nr:SRPBCC family protein [Chloroflexota bacterium]